ncbi:MAG: hypothetical protein C4589_10380 [Peptococcaceae bacterium]|nr:MAG: hypothetical protein C4589_10380 [Peptococcaceae bacterium]
MIVYYNIWYTECTHFIYAFLKSGKLFARNETPLQKNTATSGKKILLLKLILLFSMLYKFTTFGGGMFQVEY